MRPANATRTNRARSLRQADNDCEARFWSMVRNKWLNGFKFVRQPPIGKYFADFACRAERLVVELDGSQHRHSEYDRERDRFMSEQGWSVLRFPNADVFTKRDDVLKTVLAALKNDLSRAVDCSEMRFVPAVKTESDSCHRSPSPTSTRPQLRLGKSAYPLPAGGERIMTDQTG